MIKNWKGTAKKKIYRKNFQVKLWIYVIWLRMMINLELRNSSEKYSKFLNRPLI